MSLQSSSLDSAHLRPINQAELTELLENYEESFNKNLWPKIGGTVQKLAELNKQKQILAKQKEEAFNGIALGRALKASAQAKLAEADRLKQEAAREKLEIAKQRQDLLTKKFHSIFNKTPLSSEDVDALFKKYLADGSFTFEKSQEGKSFPQINTMKSVAQYLSDHPDIRVCDFRVFKTAVYDIPVLAAFLKKSTVKAVALNSGIPAEAKASLADAVAARNGSLKVQYFD
jgi:hypothetical protein